MIADAGVPADAAAAAALGPWWHVHLSEMAAKWDWWCHLGGLSVLRGWFHCTTRSVFVLTDLSVINFQITTRICVLVAVVVRSLGRVEDVD